MKKFIVSMIVCGLAFLASAAGIVQNVTLRQIRPWNGLVEIGYELTEDVVAGEGKGLETKITIRDLEHNTNYIAKTFTTTPTYGKGVHRLVWNAAADGVKFASARAAATVGILSAPPPLYCVIDLSGGTSATTYPVSYLADVPAGGWTDVYKTTKLVLRYIEPGTFTMGDQVHGGSTYANITISQPFWIGVFEVTQKQYTLVTGSSPSSYSGSMRPVECVSWNTINATDGFIARVSAKAGLVCALPTEAQWEYACRAGTRTDYNNETNYSSSSQDSNMNIVGCYYYNYQESKGGYTSGHKNVGSYVPNAWGLYDMHGNVWEWCRDWYGSLSAGVTDPMGASSGSGRVLRGGSWGGYADGCASSYRYGGNPSNGYGDNGFRLSCSPGSSDK